MHIFTWEYIFLEPVRCTTWVWDLVLFPTLDRLKAWIIIAWKLTKHSDSISNEVSASEGGSLPANRKWKHTPKSRQPKRWWKQHKSQHCKVQSTPALLQYSTEISDRSIPKMYPCKHAGLDWVRVWYFGELGSCLLLGYRTHSWVVLISSSNSLHNWSFLQWSLFICFQQQFEKGEKGRKQVMHPGCCEPLTCICKKSQVHVMV